MRHSPKREPQIALLSESTRLIGHIPDKMESSFIAAVPVRSNRTLTTQLVRSNSGDRLKRHLFASPETAQHASVGRHPKTMVLATTQNCIWKTAAQHAGVGRHPKFMVLANTQNVFGSQSLESVVGTVPRKRVLGRTHVRPP